MRKATLFCLSLLVFGCKFYSFTGASIPENAETVQVNLFANDAANSIGSIFEPGLDRDFTNAMQEVLLNQTNLELAGVNGDLIYEGEITEYRVTVENTPIRSLSKSIQNTSCLWPQTGCVLY